MKVFCISGKAGAGKDTCAEYLKLVLEMTGNRVLVTHYADLVKYIATNFFEWDGQKDENGRSLLQKIGTDIGRKNDEDIWVDFIIGVLKIFQPPYDYVLIPDCRFPNEIEKIKLAGFPTVHVRVDRPSLQSALTEEQQKHASEVSLDNFTPDIMIKNDGSINDLISSICKDIIIEIETLF